jgi:hypothetical protein
MLEIYLPTLFVNHFANSVACGTFQVYYREAESCVEWEAWVLSQRFGCTVDDARLMRTESGAMATSLTTASPHLFRSRHGRSPPLTSTRLNPQPRRFHFLQCNCFGDNLCFWVMLIFVEFFSHSGRGFQWGALMGYGYGDAILRGPIQLAGALGLLAVLKMNARRWVHALWQFGFWRCELSSEE